MEQLGYCKYKRAFFEVTEVVGIIKCPFCGEHLFKDIGNLKHTITDK